MSALISYITDTETQSNMSLIRPESATREGRRLSIRSAMLPAACRVALGGLFASEMREDILCRKCGKIKPVNAFPRSTGKKGYRVAKSGVCLECKRDAKNAYRRKQTAKKRRENPRKQTEQEELVERGLKRCTKCGDVFPLQEYPRLKHGLGGAGSWCSRCKKEHHKNSGPKPKIINEKICVQCGKLKPINQFRSRHSRKCDLCVIESSVVQKKTQKGKWREKRNKEIPHLYEKDGMKVCKTCGKVKPVVEFAENNKGNVNEWPRYSADCKQCTQEKRNNARVLWRKSENGRISNRLHDQRRRIKVKELDDGTVTAKVLREKMRRRMCPVCGKVMRLDDKTIDHIVPIAKGGLHSASNLICICHRCNSLKRDIDPDQYLSGLDDNSRLRVERAWAKESQCVIAL